MTIRLSVLDQSFTRSRDLAPQALQETIEMAGWCEQLGYHRFWVSEHHAFPTIAGSAPEVLIAALGAATQTIRLGSGGIMLPHYSAYKVAEVFSLLANLYPERIDLGIGRAPGADMSTAVALATDGRPKFERFPQLVEELTEYLVSEVATPMVSPKPPESLPIWMLGSSSDSAQLAASRGMPYNLALFINPLADPRYISHYKKFYQALSDESHPEAMVTIAVFCCETEAEARRQQLTFDINFYRFVTGQRTNPNDPLLNPEQVEDYPIDPQLEAFIRQRSLNRAVGNPDQVAEQVAQIATQYQADEVMVVTNMFDFEDRKRSFALLMDGIKKASRQ